MFHKVLRSFKGQKHPKPEPGSLEHLMGLPIELLKSEYPQEHKRIKEIKGISMKPFYFPY